MKGARSSRQTDRRRFARAGAIIVGLLAANPCAAQRFGQWWWDARLSWQERQNESTVTPQQSVRESTEREWGAELGINGYLGHPVIGRFRLGLEGSQTSGDVGIDRLGYSADVDLLPYGLYPLNLGYRLARFDVPGVSNGTVPGTGSSDEFETWNATLRLKHGPLRGLLLGGSASETRFARDTPPESTSRQFARWSRYAGRTQTAFRIDRDDREFGRIGFSTSVWTSTFDQTIRFSERSRWRTGLAGVRVESGFGRRPASQRSQQLRFESDYSLDLPRNNALEIDVTANLADPSREVRTLGYGASLRYRWHPFTPKLQLSPFVSASSVDGDSSSEETLQGGLQVAWNRAGRIDLSVVGSAASGQVRRVGDTASTDDRLSLDGAVTLAFGSPRRLRSRLEVGASRNELRFRGPDFDIDSIGSADEFLLVDRLGVRSARRFRLGLQRKRRASLDVWIEGTRAEVLSIDGAQSDQETYGTSLQVGVRRLSVTGTAGEIVVRRPRDFEEHSRFLAGSLTWQIARSLSLRASVRTQDRRIDLLPDLTSEHLEAGVEFSMGLLQFQALAFVRRDDLAGGARLEDEGFRYSVSRRLAGWLPIVTGERRKGKIL